MRPFIKFSTGPLLHSVNEWWLFLFVSPIWCGPVPYLGCVVQSMQWIKSPFQNGQFWAVFFLVSEIKAKIVHSSYPFWGSVLRLLGTVFQSAVYSLLCLESTTRRHLLEFSTEEALVLTLDTQKTYHVKIVISCEKLTKGCIKCLQQKWGNSSTLFYEGAFSSVRFLLVTHSSYHHVHLFHSPNHQHRVQFMSLISSIW